MHYFPSPAKFILAHCPPPKKKEKILPASLTGRKKNCLWYKEFGTSAFRDFDNLLIRLSMTAVLKGCQSPETPVNDIDCRHSLRRYLK